MAASRPDPTSTNVSSPAQAISTRCVRQKNNAQPELELHRKVYSCDDFVANDDDDGSFHATRDESEDGFEPIRENRQSKSLRKRSLGPPITIDEKLERLNDVHQMVVEDFLRSAKDLSQKVRSPRHQLRQGTEDYQILFQKNLKGHPFTDTVFREMAINFPQSNHSVL